MEIGKIYKGRTFKEWSYFIPFKEYAKYYFRAIIYAPTSEKIYLNNLYVPTRGYFICSSAGVTDRAKKKIIKFIFRVKTFG